jgi:dihydroorotate dehydrogenase (NAD+) catalytic subunit
VEIGTAVFTKGIDVFSKIVKGIRTYMEENGFKEVEEIVGLAHKA